MKKVRFESPSRPITLSAMHESECHSPRPFILKQVNSAPHVEYLDYRTLTYSHDPVQRFDCGNSSPYPVVSRTSLSNTAQENKWTPSNELDLSILDSALSTRTNNLNLQPTYHTEHAFMNMQPPYVSLKTNPLAEKHNTLTPVENRNPPNPPNILTKNDDFFIKRDNLNGLSSQMNKLQLDKENNPLLKKTQIMMGQSLPLRNDSLTSSDTSNEMDSPCRCHHCVQVYRKQHMEPSRVEIVKNQNINRNRYNVCHCITMMPQNHGHCTCNIPPPQPPVASCNCNKTPGNTASVPSPVSNVPVNVVDKRAWAIQRYAQKENTECLEIEKQTNITTDKQEPTVAELFKIIKMQNEQLQLLQEKVDKFISTNSNNGQQKPPIQNCMAEQVAFESGNTEQKISIGVMTSFEVVRTSTIINKEYVKQNEAQIQCNRSQISIKGVVAKQPANLNFLDGLTPVSKQVDAASAQQYKSNVGDMTNNDNGEEKMYNEISLYNVQVENAITPNISPEQSLYLDIRDYSE